LMTMHSAKGLEFPVVFHIGAEEGLFPSAMVIGNNDEMEEERRLCYVAITRAKEKLYITCAAQRMLYGRTGANLPSRFVDEIPASLTERQGAERRKQERGPHWDDDGAFRSGNEYGFSAYGRRERVRTANAQASVFRSRAASARAEGSAAESRPNAAQFKTGDTIVHKAFGEGVITKMTPMGGDALIEVSFRSGETKKLMLRIASQHMTKREPSGG
ncbi:MAG: ATP-binding domain-containing protein, partial [Oscillospiraceae bacterium]|nr:ATP-binding domain-containing protein [Oscillospiraceae bacterium]